MKKYDVLIKLLFSNKVNLVLKYYFKRFPRKVLHV